MEKMNINGKYTMITDNILDLKRIIDRNKSLLIYQNNIEELVKNFTKQAEIDSELLKIRDGESGKSLKTVEEILSYLINNNFGREDVIIAFGGGSVCDVAGFASSIFKRGMKLVMIPTTLLAMVDAAIGGKNGVNFHKTKNQIGTFYQPDLIYNNIKFVKTLDKNEFQSGLGEIIKYGVSLNEELFDFIIKNKNKIKKRELKIIKEIVKRSQKIKMNIVKKDEKEIKGIREILNVGHTIGHAIESNSNFNVKHGIAVFYGMLVECKISKILGIADKDVCNIINKIMNEFDIPNINISNNKKFRRYIINDKKITNGKLFFPAIKKIGEVELIYIDLKKFMEVLDHDEIWTNR
ncbi:MAG: 3-dehydroquinate synthase [Thermoplasmata archaeon]